MFLFICKFKLNVILSRLLFVKFDSTGKAKIFVKLQTYVIIVNICDEIQFNVCCN